MCGIDTRSNYSHSSGRRRQARSVGIYRIVRRGMTQITTGRRRALHDGGFSGKMSNITCIHTSRVYTHTSTHPHINTSTHQPINTSTHQHINTSPHQHINTSHISPHTSYNVFDMQGTLVTPRPFPVRGQIIEFRALRCAALGDATERTRPTPWPPPIERKFPSYIQTGE